MHRLHPAVHHVNSIPALAVLHCPAAWGSVTMSALSPVLRAAPVDTVEKPVMPKDISLLIKPAGPDCNAGCRYCFYRSADRHFGRGEHRMSTDVLGALTHKLLNLSLPVSQFSWQGGEPTLMGLDFFEQVVALQMQLGCDGQSVANTIQTNALLLDERWVGFLAKYRFLVGVSLDGPAEIHDQNRGKGTHQSVVTAADMLKRHGVPFNILTVVSRVNEDRGAEVYRWLREQGYSYLQFIPAVETDSHGNPLPFAPSPEGYGRFMCEVFDAWLNEDGPGKVYVRWFESLLCHLAGMPAGNCILGRRCDQYLVIEHNGDVFPCDFFVRPDMRLGNILESDLADLAESQHRRQFARAKAQIPTICRQCDYLNVCNGGCLKDRERSCGNFDGPSYLCPSYRSFYSHALKWFTDTVSRIQGRSQPPPRR